MYHYPDRNIKKATIPQTDMAATNDEYQAFLKQIHNNSSYSTDFCIQLGSCKWNVHKRVLAARSERLDPSVSLPFGDPTKDIHVIYDECPIMFVRLIHWMYQGDKSSIWTPKNRNFISIGPNRNEKIVVKAEGVDKRREEWEITALMHDLADRYIVPDLLIAAQNGILSFAKSTPEIIPAMVEAMGPSARNNMEFSKTLIRMFIKSFKTGSDFHKALDEAFRENESAKSILCETMFEEVELNMQMSRQLRSIRDQIVSIYNKAQKVNYPDGDTYRNIRFQIRGVVESPACKDTQSGDDTSTPDNSTPKK